MSDKKNRTAFIPAALCDAGLSCEAFRIWCRIARRGQLWESVPNMAKACGIGRDRTRAALQYLKREKWVACEERKGGSTRYWALHPYLEFGWTPTDSSKGPLPDSGEDPNWNQYGTPTGSGGQKIHQESPPKKKPPRRNGNEPTFDPNGLHPTGSKVRKSSSPLSEMETTELAADIVAKEGRDPESAIAAFPTEEVVQWAIDWHLENEATGWVLRGAPIKNPRAALRRFLRKVAGTRTKRFKEMTGANPDADVDAPF